MTMDYIIECNVWCVGSSQTEIELGLPVGDSWMPIAVDFRTISSIKLSGENEFLGNDKSTIYFNGREITIDISYKTAVKMWRDILKDHN